MKSIKTKNIFLGLGIFIAFIILQVIVSYKFHLLDKNIVNFQNDMELSKKFYEVYINELKYKQNQIDKQQLLHKIENLPMDDQAILLTKLRSNDLIGFERFINKKISSINKQSSKFTIDIMHENIVMFIIILIVNIFINIALYLFARQIIDNIEILKNGLNSFFKYLNRETNDVKEIKVKTEDEFKDMADMINQNIKKIKTDLQKDIQAVENIRDVSNKMARGDFSILITSTPANPEIAELKTTLNTFVKTIKQTFDSILDILDEYKNEDYSRRLKIDAKGEIKELIDGVNALGKVLEIGAINIEKSLTDKSNLLKETSNTLSQNIDSLSNALSSTSKNVDIVSLKTEEITSNIKNTVEKINKMKIISDDTKNEALKGEKLAIDTLNAMQDIAESTNAIQEAITIIDTIAFQTNILSLNAAVEAATAGEAGKGFAVVAGEVRNLANKSASAAKKIKELVNKTEIKASEGIEISDNMKNNFLGVVEKINTTSIYVNEITEGANLEAKKIEEINKSIQEIHTITDESKEIMQNTYVVSYDLNQISTELYEEVNKVNNG